MEAAIDNMIDSMLLGAPNAQKVTKEMVASYDHASVRDMRGHGQAKSAHHGIRTPEAQEGGPLALVKTGDKITVDAEKRRIDMHVSDAELATRRAGWKAPPYKATRGTLYKYIKSVKSASEGCVTDE